MVEEQDFACVQVVCWGESVLVRGWGAPLGGLSAMGSSSEELSSDAPRMNLRRSLISGPELAMCVFEVLAAEGTCRASVSTVLASRSPDVVPIWGPGPSLCSEVEGTVDGECSPGGGDCAVDETLAEGGKPSDLSSFTGIINDLVLILQNKYNIHRISPNSAKGSIHGHSPEAATTGKKITHKLNLLKSYLKWCILKHCEVVQKVEVQVEAHIWPPAEIGQKTSAKTKIQCLWSQRLWSTKRDLYHYFVSLLIIMTSMSAALHFT